ncbi:hypothetical protein NMG60_11026122 [Bertholletia excelsa]
MVNPGRKQHLLSERFPQFFKIYVPNQSSRRLRIPPEFLSQFNGVLPRKSKITTTEKGSWRVEIKKENGNLYFVDGWHQFVLENSLEFGDFLLFYYGRNSNFYIKIYGKNGCLKEVSNPTGKRRNTSVVLNKNRAVEPNNSFQKQIQILCVSQCNKILTSSVLQTIPSSFSRSHLEINRKSVTLVFLGKSWPVKLVWVGKKCMYSGGWRQFCRDTDLKIGDICVFELLKRDEFVLRVYIFRCLVSDLNELK